MELDADLGVQPLDTLLTRLNIPNTELVRVSTLQLTHKMVAKGRKGRRLTSNVKNKILMALQQLRPDDKLTMKDLFNY